MLIKGTRLLMEAQLLIGSRKFFAETDAVTVQKVYKNLTLSRQYQGINILQKFHVNGIF